MSLPPLDDLPRLPRDEAGPVFREPWEAEAFAMERQVVLEELAQSEDQPAEVAVQTLLARACPDHP